MKKVVLFSLVGLLVLLVAAVLIGPSFVDWNAHKGRIVAAIEEKTGRAAAIDGDISLSILPTPALRVAGVRIANFKGAESKDMLRLKELRLRVSIGALLQGRVAVEQLDLVEPVINLEVAADGKASWDLQQPAADTSGPAAGTAAAGGEGETGVDISLAGVTIQNGTITYRDDKSGKTESVSGVNMAVSAPSLAGPFTVSAEGRYHDLPLTLDVKTGTVNQTEPVLLSVNAAVPSVGATLKFDGKVSKPGPDAQVTGDLTVSADNADRLVSLAKGSRLSSVLAQPLSVEGGLTASRKAIALNDTRLRFGDTVGSGAVNVSLGNVINADVAVSINRIDLDKLMADLTAAPAAPAPKKEAGSAPTAVAPKSAASSEAKVFSLPTNVNATLDLDVEAIQYRGDVIRQAGIRGALANGAITLDHASALLPGSSDVSVVGFLQAAGKTPKFDGDIAVASDDLRAMLRWLGIDINTLPADRLRGFSYSGKISATPEAVQIPDFNLRLDTTTVRGALALALRKRIGFGLRLDADQLNLDSYFPDTAVANKAKATGGSAASTKPAASATSKGSAGGGPLAFLDSFDANIDAKLDRLTYRKTVAHKVAFSGQLVGGTLTIRQLGVAEVAGAKVAATGTVQKLSATPTFSIGYDVAVKQPEQLFRVLDTPMPVSAAKLGTPTVRGQVSGNLSSVTLNTDVAAAGAKLHFDGPLDLAEGAPAFNFKVALEHPELKEFVRLGMPDFRPAANKLGPLKAQFGLKGTPASIAVSSLDMAAGPVTVKGAVSLQLDGPKPVINADLATSEVLLDLFEPASSPEDTATARARQRALAMSSGSADGGSGAVERWSRDPIDVSGLQAVDATVRLAMAGLDSGNLSFEKPQVEADLKDGKLQLRQFKAGLFGGTVAGQGSVDSAGGDPKVAMNLSATGIDMVRAAKAFGSQPRVAGPLSVTAALTTAGASQAALIGALSGTGDISGKARVLATAREQQAIGAVGIAAALFGDKVKELQQVGGLTNVLVQAFGNAPADLSGKFTVQQGILRTQDTVLKGAGATAKTVAVIDLPRWTIESTTSLLRSSDSPDSPYVTVGLNGPLDAPNVRAGGSFLQRKTGGSTNPLNKVLPGVLDGNETSKDVKPQDVLRGLLKGLSK